MDQDIFNALDTLLVKDRWDKLVLLTPVENWYPLLAHRISIPIIVVCDKDDAQVSIQSQLRKKDFVIPLPCEVNNAEDLFNLAIALAITEGVFSHGDHVIFLGATLNKNAHFILLSQISESSLSELYRVITDPEMPNPDVVKAVLTLALELGRLRKQPAGALYVIGDTNQVLKYSTQLFMNPFEGQPVEKRNIKNRWMNDTLKEYARLDGAVIIDNEGVVHAAGVYINADTRNVDILIEGTRHATAAAITHLTDAIAITVSEKTGMIMLFKSGPLLLKVGP
jgi:DNA integrity scanning protein DisA with diadenylate cyclase activity